MPIRNHYLKDLTRLGRSLNTTIIVDNLKENFSLQPRNGIEIKTWMSDGRDTALFQLAPLLLKVVEGTGVEDVRVFLDTQRNLNKPLIDAIAFGQSLDMLSTEGDDADFAQKAS